MQPDYHWGHIQKRPTPTILGHVRRARRAIFGGLTVTRLHFMSTERLQACQSYLGVHAARVWGLSVSLVSLCRSSGIRESALSSSFVNTVYVILLEKKKQFLIWTQKGLEAKFCIRLLFFVLFIFFVTFSAFFVSCDPFLLGEQSAKTLQLAQRISTDS